MLQDNRLRNISIYSLKAINICAIPVLVLAGCVGAIGATMGHDLLLDLEIILVLVSLIGVSIFSLKYMITLQNKFYTKTKVLINLSFLCCMGLVALCAFCPPVSNFLTRHTMNTPETASRSTEMDMNAWQEDYEARQHKK